MPRLWSTLDDLLNLGLEARLFRRTERTIGELAVEIMNRWGEASVTALAEELLTDYASLDDQGKLEFFLLLLADFGPDQASLDTAIHAYLEDKTPEVAHELDRASEPRRQGLIRLLNTAPGGTASLIAMREDLLVLLKDNPTLRPVDNDFEHLFASWFNRGFLQIRRMDWSTPANILEKIIAYEAVHEVRDWNDLRRRLQEDRRCFGFFHPVLPDEPLIFVEVALTVGLAASVDALLDGEVSATQQADTAIFYSISNCQKGLKNIAFGNFLIKQVVAELRQELPQLTQFSTLSPVPGFMSWLETSAPHVLDDLEDATELEPSRDELLGLCAHYLADCKKGLFPLDPVARFHLRNGAVLERINWQANTSPAGLQQSAGIMVNYLYDERRLATNHEAFVARGEVRTSSAVAALARKGKELA